MEFEKALDSLIRAAEGLGFVSDEARDKLHEAVEIILSDPRNDE